MPVSKVVHAYNPSIRKLPRWDCPEFKVSLYSRASTRPVRVTLVKYAFLKNKKTKRCKQKNKSGQLRPAIWHSG